MFMPHQENIACLMENKITKTIRERTRQEELGCIVKMKKDWCGWVMRPEWTRIEEPNKRWTGLREENRGRGDRGRTGRRPSTKTCEDWNWRGKKLSTRRRTEMVGGNALPDVQLCTGRT